MVAVDTDIVRCLLQRHSLFLHEYSHNIVASQTPGLFHIIRVHILHKQFVSFVDLCGRFTYVRPTDIIASSPISVHKC